MNIFFMFDTHFGHKPFVEKFIAKDGIEHPGWNRDDGSPARDFTSIEAHDEFMLDAINAAAKPDDHLYFGGDVAKDAKVFDAIMPRIACKYLRLLRGNHDLFSEARYRRFFEKIMATRKFDGLLFSHYPIAPWAFGRWTTANVHGHSHHRLPLIYTSPSPKLTGNFPPESIERARSEHEARQRIYVNASVENTGYRPISLDELRSMIDGYQETSQPATHQGEDLAGA